LHFSTSTKCIQIGCAKDIHEAWWHSARIKKLGTAAISNCTLVKNTTTRPRHQPRHTISSKGTIFNFQTYFSNFECIIISIVFIFIPNCLLDFATTFHFVMVSLKMFFLF
jgi:hypothetical protein